jgi:hypothetical protein
MLSPKNSERRRIVAAAARGIALTRPLRAGTLNAVVQPTSFEVRCCQVAFVIDLSERKTHERP